MNESRPQTIEILGITYTITYCDKPSDVDHRGRHSLWGQVDFWQRSIRIYDKNSSPADVWETLIHETLHVLIVELKLKGKIEDGDLPTGEQENIVGLLALGLRDVLFRNGWIKP